LSTTTYATNEHDTKHKLIPQFQVR